MDTLQMDPEAIASSTDDYKTRICLLARTLAIVANYSGALGRSWRNPSISMFRSGCTSYSLFCFG
jgi:hypothetical protein